MKIRTRSRFSLTALFFPCITLLLLPFDAQCRPITETGKVGAYSVTLKVLPAESFAGPAAQMIRTGGANPVLLHGRDHPNHHLVAFVEKDGKPVEDAKVAVRYRRLSPKGGAWTTLPVVRMYAAGKGLASTHYGNNVALGPGSYEVRVSVDGKPPATFRFSLAE